jgi:hypothetical protein
MSVVAPPAPPIWWASSGKSSRFPGKSALSQSHGLLGIVAIHSLAGDETNFPREPQNPSVFAGSVALGSEIRSRGVGVAASR